MKNLLQNFLPWVEEKNENFQVKIIDGTTREERNFEETNIETRNYGMYPKTGDWIQIARYAVRGPESIYIPARVVITKENPIVYIDLMDWKMPIVHNADSYSNFISPASCEKGYMALKEEEERLRGKGVGYEIILRDAFEKTIAIKRMPFLKNYWELTLTNYQAGKPPFPELFNSDDLFDEINGLSKEELIVEAVLHPIVGLPKVLVLDVEEKDIFRF
ncbi:MAG: hypothetical protein ACOYT4_00690 [Nanoarchaeota archaeon]